MLVYGYDCADSFWLAHFWSQSNLPPPRNQKSAVYCFRVPLFGTKLLHTLGLKNCNQRHWRLKAGSYFAAGRSTGRSTGRSAQIAARRPHGVLCVRTRNSIYVHIHAARKWNCWEFRCAISGNTEKVEICLTRCGLRPAACDLRPATCDLRPAACSPRPAACGLRPAAKYEPIKPIHSFYFSCGLRPAAKYEPALSLSFVSVLISLKL